MLAGPALGSEHTSAKGARATHFRLFNSYAAASQGCALSDTHGSCKRHAVRPARTCKTTKGVSEDKQEAAKPPQKCANVQEGVERSPSDVGRHQLGRSREGVAPPCLCRHGPMRAWTDRFILLPNSRSLHQRPTAGPTRIPQHVQGPSQPRGASSAIQPPRELW